jgi:peptidoglycan/LPS O-acetylase OafA/YrhL
MLCRLCIVVAAGLYFVAVRAARRREWGAGVLIGLSVLSHLVLNVMVLTDWPGEQLNKFWADHSIFASVLSALLLVSLGYLAFEGGETAEQAELRSNAFAMTSQ